MNQKQFSPAICPTCNEALQIPTDRDSVICAYCGNVISVADALRRQPGASENGMVAAAVQHLQATNYGAARDTALRLLEADPARPESRIILAMTADDLNEAESYYNGAQLSQLPAASKGPLVELLKSHAQKHMYVMITSGNGTTENLARAIQCDRVAFSIQPEEEALTRLGIYQEFVPADPQIVLNGMAARGVPVAALMAQHEMLSEAKAEYTKFANALVGAYGEEKVRANIAPAPAEVSSNFEAGGDPDTTHSGIGIKILIGIAGFGATFIMGLLRGESTSLCTFIGLAGGVLSMIFVRPKG